MAHLASSVKAGLHGRSSLHDHERTGQPTHLDALQGGRVAARERAQDVLARDAEAAQAVQDGPAMNNWVTSIQPPGLMKMGLMRDSGASSRAPSTSKQSMT